VSRFAAAFRPYLKNTKILQRFSGVAGEMQTARAGALRSPLDSLLSTLTCSTKNSEVSNVVTITIQPSLLATRRGKLILALLCAVGFLDFIDATIVNVALPSIRHDMHMSVQSLQWLLSAYLLTYGGFMLLGGRAADLLGRRRFWSPGHRYLRSRLSVRTGGELRES